MCFDHSHVAIFLDDGGWWSVTPDYKFRVVDMGLAIFDAKDIQVGWTIGAANDEAPCCYHKVEKIEKTDRHGFYI
jgi:hypothetical protein